jgi:4-amino-4-deoxy-L-arabinose transferase-like glycosyltransferase
LRAAFSGSRLVLWGDEMHYAESLHHFMQGRFLEGCSDYWSFLYPLVAVPFGKLYGDAEGGLRLLSMLAGAAVVAPAMLLALRLWGRRAAIFTGALIALHPMLISHSTGAMTEPLYSLLLMLSLYLFVQYVWVGRWWRLVLTAVLLGLAYQTRQEAQFLALGAAVAVLIGSGGEGVRGRTPIRITRAAVLVAVFVVSIMPYLLVLHAKTGRWTGGSKAAVNLSSPAIWRDDLERERYVYRLNDAGTERRIEEIGREGPAKIIWAQRKTVAAQYLRKLHRGFNLAPIVLATPLLLLLVPLGIFGRRWERGSRGIELMLLFAGFFPFALYAVFQIQVRYLVPFVPLYLMWAARGCEVLLAWLKEHLSARPVIGAIALVLVFGNLAALTVRQYSYNLEHLPVEHRKIGSWIGAQLGGGYRILAHSGCSVSYYAGSPEATFIPWTDHGGLLRYARHHGYDLLVVDESYFRKFRPVLAEFLEEPAPQGLEWVETFTGRNGPIRLYRFTGGR